VSIFMSKWVHDCPQKVLNQLSKLEYNIISLLKQIINTVIQQACSPPFLFCNNAVIQNLWFKIFKYTLKPYSRIFEIFLYYILNKECPVAIVASVFKMRITLFYLKNYLANIFCENVDVSK